MLNYCKMYGTSRQAETSRYILTWASTSNLLTTHLVNGHILICDEMFGASASNFSEPCTLHFVRSVLLSYHLFTLSSSSSVPGIWRLFFL
jgi:hypothetical protein